MVYPATVGFVRLRFSIEGAKAEPDRIVRHRHLWLERHIPNAPESNVITGCSLFAFAACPNHIACAILVGTQERTASMHPFFFGGFGWVK